jgi:hypothetical protein
MRLSFVYVTRINDERTTKGADMTTTWKTYSKIEIGESVKSPGSGRVWRDRKQAEDYSFPFRVVVTIEKPWRSVVRLVFADGSSVENSANAKALVAERC